MIIDEGLWYIGQNRGDKRVYVESDDFTHDVRLYIDGDFADDQQKMKYAEGVAYALNRFLKMTQKEREGKAYVKNIR